jgi:deoxyribonuclease-4
MLLGAHVSIAGGYHNAATEAGRLGMQAIQIFTKNQRTWNEKTVTEQECALFREACSRNGVLQAFSHSIYLISLGSQNDEIAQKSMLSLAMELERCHALGLTHTVLHPGFAGALSVDDAITLIAERIKKVLSVTKSSAKILIENTAGQGSSVGGKIDHIARLLTKINSKRVGLCIDTCHAFASGYDIRDKQGIRKFIKEIDDKIGLERLLCFHLNDSKGGLGSRLDRHAHIGQGLLGLAAFEYIMKNFPEIPKVLETSKENDADRKNLEILRRLGSKK